MQCDDLPIAEPCEEDWDAMTGPGARRFCGQCSKHVHDLSAMTEDEARAVLATESRPCVRYRVSASGAIVFRPAPPSVASDVVPIAALRRRATALPPAAALALALAACTPHGDAPRIDRATTTMPDRARAVEDMARRDASERVVMGEMMPEEPCDPPKDVHRPRMGKPVIRGR